jgi:hypothetical protein
VCEALRLTRWRGSAAPAAAAAAAAAVKKLRSVDHRRLHGAHVLERVKRTKKKVEFQERKFCVSVFLVSLEAVFSGGKKPANFLCYTKRQRIS